MGFQVPELIKIELSRALEGVFNRRRRRRESEGGVLKIFLGMVLFGGLVFLVATFFMHRPAPENWLSSQEAWFYDHNTGKIFKGQATELGPIEAPSGPLKFGKPAGFRAHVYSYYLEPKHSELFVGFLERPDPDYNDAQELSTDMKDYYQWVQGRQIKRPDDDRWVSAASPEGGDIVRSFIKPNSKGQTPIYQIP